jgi:predicted DCC family thiol-disulfide oxidoreductase YuxK
MTDESLELVYSSDCPYCRAAVRAVRVADVRGEVRVTPIESERGERLVEDHHGEYRHVPHLFTEDLVYYGVGPTFRGLALELPATLLSGSGKGP